MPDDDFGQVIGTLTGIINNLPQAMGNALYGEGQVELTEMKRRTPVDSGALRSSGHLVGPKFSGREISIEFAFGGSAAPYAVYVHEDLEAFHGVGQAKFVESVLMESAPHMLDRVGRRALAEVIR